MMTPDDDWQPPFGMVKRSCSGCGKPFATVGRRAVCPTCRTGASRGGYLTRDLTASPLDPDIGSSGRRIPGKRVGGG